mgnify:CR=1 FL=1
MKRKAQGDRALIAGTSRQRGRWAESLALGHLLEQGLTLHAQNYQARCGEIDLILQDGDTIVFLEVRYRTDNLYMHALETINARKCDRIIKTSLHYLQKHRAASKKTCRFDVIIIFGSVATPSIRWIKNAFQA